METPRHGPVERALNRILVPLFYPEYRRLVTRSFILSMRLELLCAMFTLVAPFATPGLLLLLRRWFEDLRADVTAFSRLVRKQTAAMPRRIAMTPAAPCNRGEFRNPWI